jgi:hypothetical protein
VLDFGSFLEPKKEPKKIKRAKWEPKFGSFLALLGSFLALFVFLALFLAPKKSQNHALQLHIKILFFFRPYKKYL